MSMVKKLKAVLQRETGQGMTEYALVLGIISVVILVLLAAYWQEILVIFQERLAELQTRHQIP